jgi:ribosomal protein S18 acetylase RimI-like enzyme
MLRPATPEDRAASIALLRAEDAAWADDEPVSDEELGDVVDRFPDVAVFADDDTLLGLAGVSEVGGTLLVVDPAIEPARVLPELVAWIDERGGAHELDAYAQDTKRQAWFEANGFPYKRSLYDLVRGADAPELAAAAWPDGVRVSRYVPNQEDAAIHALIYREAAWAEVAGHHERDLESWWATQTPEHRSWIARRAADGAPVGWISGIAYPDGRGWISQIAVARADRGRGLGRALLLHSGADLLAHGATSLALGVQAANINALALYRSAGFDVAREWRYHGRPD